MSPLPRYREHRLRARTASKQRDYRSLHVYQLSRGLERIWRRTPPRKYKNDVRETHARRGIECASVIFYRRRDKAPSVNQEDDSRGKHKRNKSYRNVSRLFSSTIRVAVSRARVLYDDNFMWVF